MADLHWTKATVGCYWYATGHTGEIYGISTVHEGNRPGYYRLTWRRGETLGPRFATLADAQQAAARHDAELAAKAVRRG